MSPPGVVRSDTVVTVLVSTGQMVSPPGVVRSDTVVTVLVTV